MICDLRIAAICVAHDATLISRNRRDFQRVELRDTENVPLDEDLDSYFEREVKPHVPDVWINIAIRDHKDSEVGKVGYEINFNRYFYKYQPPRPLAEIEADIQVLEQEIMGMLREVAG